LAGEPKELRRTVALEIWGNRYAVRALEEISRAYREMLVELVDYAVRYKASPKTLHRMFYGRYRSTQWPGKRSSAHQCRRVGGSFDG